MSASEQDSDESFKPPFPWRFALPALAVVGLFIGGWFYRDHQRKLQFRAQILSEHETLTREMGPEYRSLRARIERLTFGTIGPWQGTWVSPGFTYQQLSSEPVLFGRVRIPELRRIEDVSTSIRHRYEDQIASCLGVELSPIHQWYSRGDFLMPSYVESIQGVESAERLRMLREDLQFRLRRDTPDLVAGNRRRYFVLAVDEAALSIDGPTRVYVWDLRGDSLMLRARGEGSGTMLVPVRIAGMPGGGQRIPQPTNELTLTQHDCDVANSVRSALGVEGLTLHHAPEPVSAANDAGNDASAADVSGD